MWLAAYNATKISIIIKIVDCGQVLACSEAKVPQEEGYAEVGLCIASTLGLH